MSERKLSLGLFVYAFGHSPAGWLHPGSPVDAATSLPYFQTLARTAEDALLDFLFFADLPASGEGSYEFRSRVPTHMNRFEPITLLSALAASTKNIGLAATASTSFTEPFNVARQFASLDHLSGGRSAWNVVTSDHVSAARNFGKDQMDPHEVRYARAREHLEVVNGLWDSFESDALKLDRTSGVYLDANKVHPLNHKGPHFSVRGPLNISRSPQGKPVIAQAGGSEEGMDFAAETADVVFTVAGTIEKARTFRQSLHDRMKRFGRTPDQIKVLPGINIIVGETDEAARAKLEELLSAMHPEAGKALLSQFLETDLSDISFDDKFPVERLPTQAKGSKSLFETMSEFVRQGLTLRELVRVFAEKQAGNGILGSPGRVADFMEDWMKGEAADGFILLLPSLPSSLTDVAQLLVPELQRRGLFRTEYEGTTLRANLGLSTPINRYES